VIVETHSQYFIRRLVRRTAEREDLADKINILFVRPPRGKKGATIAPLEMNEKGDISNWPPDFFPEPDEDTGKTLAARFERGEQ
jgi:predicted ATPase